MACSTIHADATSRAAFERYWRRSRAEPVHRDRLQARDEDGCYTDRSVQRHWWTWQRAMHSTGAPPMACRAFEIADRAMYLQLREDGVPLEASPDDATSFGFVDVLYQEVPALAQASAAMQQAFEWLKERGYVQLGTDAGGEFVEVLRRPGEDAE